MFINTLSRVIMGIKIPHSVNLPGNRPLLHRHWVRLFSILFILLACPLCPYALISPPPLTLQEAESLVIQKHLNSDTSGRNINRANPAIKPDSNTSNKNDAGLTFGVQKILPDESYPISQEDNTLYKVGIQQKIPRSEIYVIKNQQAQVIDLLADKKQKDETLILHREIRNVWLSLYYWLQAQKDVEETQDSFIALENHTPGNKTDIAIKSYLNKLFEEDKQIQIQINNQKQQLIALIGKENAQRTLPQDIPNWPAPPPLDQLQARLLKHPKMQKDSAAIQAVRANTSLNKARNKSTVGIGASYGVRQEEFMGGNPRPDMFSAELKLHLSTKADQQPSPGSRSNIAELEAAQLNQERDFRELTADLRKNYSNWANFSKKATLLNEQTLPTVLGKTNATLEAYKRNTYSDIKPVIKAYQLALKTKLDALTASVNAAKSRANLLYYE